MADPLIKICNELGVCREEALFYLEGFQWNLDAAMEACRSKTLPEYEKAAAEEPLRNEKIKSYIEFCAGATKDEAIDCLSYYNWNINAAIDAFYSQQRPTASERKENSKMRQSNSHLFSNDGRLAMDQTYLQRFSGDQPPMPLTSPEVMQDVLSRVPEFPINSSEMLDPDFIRAVLPSSMSMSHEPSPSQPNDEDVIKTFCGRVIGASPKAALDCLNYCNWHVEDAIGYYFRGYRGASPGIATAHVVKNFTGKAVGEGVRTESVEHVPGAVPPMASSQVAESGNLTQATEEQLIGSSQLPNQEEQFQLQMQFCSVAPEASPKAAQACLIYCKWNLQDALTFFKRSCIEASPVIASSQVDNVLVPPLTESAEAPPNSQAQLYNEEIITSFRAVAVEMSREAAIRYLEFCGWDAKEATETYLAGFSAEQLYAAKMMSLTELPSQSQFEASYVSQSQGYLKEGGTGSSPSSTETQRSLEEAGEGNVTVAIPGMASSQADDAITITLHLADGRSLDLTFGSNQTVKDIRNAIDERAPDNDRDYYLQALTGDEYRDLNITVQRISTRGSTILLQVFLDQ